MRKELIGLIIGGCVVGGAIMATDVKTSFTSRDVRDPEKLKTYLSDNFTAIDARTNNGGTFTQCTLQSCSNDTITASGNATIGGTLGVTGVLTASGGVKWPVSTDTAVTNGQVLTLSYGVNVLVPQGSAANATNTVTLANPAAGQRSWIVVKTGSTNVLAVAKTGNFYSTALGLSAGDTAELMGVSASAWYGK